MKILYVVQCGMTNQKVKKFSARRDGNLKLAAYTLWALKQRYQDLEVDVVTPELNMFEGISDLSEIFAGHEIFAQNWINYIPVTQLHTPHFNRYLINLMQLKNMNLSYDLIINDIAEITRNLKTIYPNTPIVSNIHYAIFRGENLVPENVDYLWRQFDSIETSEFTTVVSETILRDYKAQIKQFINEPYASNLSSKLKLFNLIYTQEELNNYRPKKNKINDKPTIIFTVRLFDNKRTNYTVFIDMLKYLNDKKYKVIFCNPDASYTYEKLRAIIPRNIDIDVGPFTRRQYIRRLWQSDINVSLYTTERFCGGSTREAIACENLPVVPALYEYVNMCGKNYQYYTNVNPVDIANTIRRASESLPTTETKTLQERIYNLYSVEANYNKYVATIDKIINKEGYK